MSIAAGVVLSITTAATVAWLAAGERLARVPLASRVLTWLDGGFNVPSEAAVDELVDHAARLRANGLDDPDDMTPEGMTLGEALAAAADEPAVPWAAVDAASQYAPMRLDMSEETTLWRLPLQGRPIAPTGGVRGWFAGGYNVPSASEVDAAPPHTRRGAYRHAVPAGWIFADEAPEEYQRSAAILRDWAGGPLATPGELVLDERRGIRSLLG